MATTISPPSREVSHGRRLARWAWVCVGLTPVAWALGGAAEEVITSAGEDLGRPWYMGVLIFLLYFTPGPATFVVAFLARRADRDAGKAVFVVAAGLAAFTVFVFAGGYGGSPLVGVAAAAGSVIVILLAVYVWPGLTKPPSRA